MNDISNPRNTVGRPRTSSPSPERCIELGEDLVKWATEKTDEWRCLFQQWYSLKQGILRNDWKAMIKTDEFRPYYEKAQSALAMRAVDGTMKEGFGQRYIRLYDRELTEEENEAKKFDAQLRKDVLRDTADILVNVINYSKDKKIVAESPENNNASL